MFDTFAATVNHGKLFMFDTFFGSVIYVWYISSSYLCLVLFFELFMFGTFQLFMFGTFLRVIYVWYFSVIYVSLFMFGTFQLFMFDTSYLCLVHFSVIYVWYFPDGRGT